jgi:hypothetical protein
LALFNFGLYWFSDLIILAVFWALIFPSIPLQFSSSLATHPSDRVFSSILFFLWVFLVMQTWWTWTDFKSIRIINSSGCQYRKFRYLPRLWYRNLS